MPHLRLQKYKDFLSAKHFYEKKVDFSSLPIANPCKTLPLQHDNKPP
jgi:hypothetical protein